ncbi:Sulfotransferase family protein [Gammaproteobacteria bacterium]
MSDRTSLFKPNLQLDILLKEVNSVLERTESERFTGGLIPTLPVVFVVGAPRTGTTLALQWLASTRVFSYPTNLLSRFFRAPYLGARIQQLLTDPNFDFAGELTGAGISGKSWASTAGKTVGPLEPHEFSYFWRRFYPIGQARPLTEDEISKSDAAGFANGIALIQQALQKPFAAKGIILQYNLAHLAALLPTSIFIRTTRDPFLTVYSLLHARRKVFGSVDSWFSVEPPGTSWLRTQDPYVQVAGQVMFTNYALEKQCAQLPQERVLTLDYETFCKSPEVLYKKLVNCMHAVGFKSSEEYSGLASFVASDKNRATKSEQQQISDAIEFVALSRDLIFSTPA